MADTPAFSPLVPGFEFLQNLVKNAGSAMPSVGQWIAPTLNPEELDKRIGELRTVQFWLEQNARVLATTIQALEVQRMTLSTLKTMNVQMGDLRESLQARVAPSAAADAEPPRADAPEAPAAQASAAPSAAPAVDPMQWWGALTKQFSQLAASALSEPPGAGPSASAANAPSPARATRKARPAAPAAAAAPRKRAAPKR